MTSALTFARKETLEILRTWRIYVLPAILLLFAVTGPLLAQFTPQLLTAVGGDQFASLEVPTPTVFDSYAQWAKNLSQIGILALIIIYGGIVSSECRSGTAVLVLTKPMTRSAFIAVKSVVHSLYIAAILVVGTAVTWGVTAIVFGEAPAGPVWSSALVWLVLALFYLSLTVLFSVLVPSAAGAAGAGLGAFALLSIGGMWRPLADHSPAGLLTRAASLAAGDQSVSLLWPVVVSLALSVCAICVATLIFRRREL